MKKISLLFLMVFFVQCNAQSSQKNVAKSAVEIADLKQNFTCKTEKIEFHIPDIYGKNEANFFNKQITEGISEVFDLDLSKANSPKQVLQEIFNFRKKQCQDKNENGGVSNINLEIGINNGKILSLSLQFEIITGSVNFSEQIYNFDISNKKRINTETLFSSENIQKINTLVNKEIRSRIEEYNKEEKDESEQEIVNDLLSQFDFIKISKTSDFKISKDGIEFMSDYGIPRGTLPLENNVFLSFKEINQYLKPDFKKFL